MNNETGRNDGLLMRLYHTGRTGIRKPDISIGRKNADFGPGFYLTPDRDFAWRWASGEAVVSVFDLDLSGLRVCRFTRTEEWFRYIFSNRRAEDTLDVDMVVGPIANDTIFETLGIITSGFLTPADALQLLMIGPEYTQVALKTEKAAGQLQWLSSSVVTAADIGSHKAALQAEREDYQRQFAEALERIGAFGS